MALYNISVINDADGCNHTLVLKQIDTSVCSTYIVKINDNYYEDLTEENIIDIIDQIKNGEKPKSGSYKNRISSESAPE